MFDLHFSYTTKEKLEILADAAKYDVACTSSGVDRKGKKGALGNSVACGICHSFGADGRCISLLKILMTNHCAYDCKYCINRRSNDVPRATFEPDELCQLVIEFYKRNYIEGLFLSSGVLKNPTYTMEKMCETLLLLRTKYAFNGYIHVKTIPGAPDELLSTAGLLADRISVNLELPTSESLHALAPNKSFQTILDPMGKVTDTIAAHRLAIGKDARMERSRTNQYLSNSIFFGQNRDNRIDGGATQTERIDSDDTRNHRDYDDTSSSWIDNPGIQNDQFSYDSSENSQTSNPHMQNNHASGVSSASADRQESDNIEAALKRHKLRPLSLHQPFLPSIRGDSTLTRPFAPAGQSTQMMIGATNESDLTLIKTSQLLYQNYDLKRVFYSAYIPLNEDSSLPQPGTAPPLLREHRLYQADWLLRFYGFQADELLSNEKPNFNEQLDPKCDWALRHLGDFPVEVQTAPFDQLLRIPGIGPKSAGRIMNARRYGKLDYQNLKKMGVVLKRAHYFITCNGKMMFPVPLEEQYITRQLVADHKKENWEVQHQNESYHQMSLFDDFNLKP